MRWPLEDGVACAGAAIGASGGSATVTVSVVTVPSALALVVVVVLVDKSNKSFGEKAKKEEKSRALQAYPLNEKGRIHEVVVDSVLCEVGCTCFIRSQKWQQR